MAKTILSRVENIAPVKGMIGKKRIDKLKKAFTVYARAIPEMDGMTE